MEKNIVYRVVDSAEIAKRCDDLLTELIMSERKFDNNIKETFRVNNFYTEMYNRDKHVLICASFDNEVIGFVYGFLKESSGELLYDNVGLVDAVFVKEGFRRQGVASNLINEFFKWCDLNDIKYIEIGSFVENEDAYNLYRKLGFEVISYRMKKVNTNN